MRDRYWNREGAHRKTMSTTMMRREVVEGDVIGGFVNVMLPISSGPLALRPILAAEERHVLEEDWDDLAEAERDDGKIVAA